MLGNLLVLEVSSRPEENMKKEDLEVTFDGVYEDTISLTLEGTLLIEWNVARKEWYWEHNDSHQKGNKDSQKAQAMNFVCVFNLLVNFQFYI